MPESKSSSMDRRFVLSVQEALNYSEKEFGKKASNRLCSEIENAKNKINGNVSMLRYIGYKTYANGNTLAFYRYSIASRFPFVLLVTVDKDINIRFDRLFYGGMNIEKRLRRRGIVFDQDNTAKKKFCAVRWHNEVSRHIYESQRRRRERLNRLRLERLEREERYLRMKARLGNW